jgi:hypothetical protein
VGVFFLLYIRIYYFNEKFKIDVMEGLTLEQKIIKYLADKGYITNVGDVITALKDFSYAEKMVTVKGEPGLKDDIKDAIISGEVDGEVSGDCDHEPLTNEEIQEVFDNDNK